MQDLGGCEDIICHDDDYIIPDVDKTFCNFEEFFGGDQDPIGAFLDENDFSCSFIEKDMPPEKSNNSDGRARKVWFDTLIYEKKCQLPNTIRTVVKTGGKVSIQKIFVVEIRKFSHE
jgi:hypothetical protein